MIITIESANSDEFNAYVHAGAFNITTDREAAAADMTELLLATRNVRVRVGYDDDTPVVSHHYLKTTDAEHMIYKIGLTIDGKVVY